MFNFLKIFILTSIFLLNGCSSLGIEGGIAETIFAKETVTVDQDGIKHTTKENLVVKTTQPNNPANEAMTKIDLKNGTVLQNVPGSTVPKEPSQTSVSLGRIAFLGGIVIVVGGVLAALYSLKIGISVGVTGAILIGISVAMEAAQGYLGLILTIAIAAVIIYGIITAYKWTKDTKALEQTKEAIDNTKDNPAVWKVLKSELSKAQDEDVKKKIRSLK